MQIVYAIILFLVSLLVIYMTYKDEKFRKPSLTVSYLMHIKGYIGGVGLILIGLILLVKK